MGLLGKGAQEKSKDLRINVIRIITFEAHLKKLYKKLRLKLKFFRSCLKNRISKV